MFETVKRWFRAAPHDEALHDKLEKLRKRTPVPVFWLFGKTQSGKTSIIKYLTGASDAEVGEGFRPCTRYSREYLFPTAEAPVINFLDTRGVDEPGYDLIEDLNRFNSLAHVVIITIKVMDHAQENVLRHLRTIRAAQPTRPIILALTCLHEGYPQQQHPQPYPYHLHQPSGNGQPDLSQLHLGPWSVDATAVPEALRRSLTEQYRRFEGLVDKAVPIDLTRPEEGYAEPTYGGEALKHALLEVLPTAFRQTLLTLDEANHTLQDLYTRRSLPHIFGYSTLAATAGAIPVPWLDLMILPGIQTQMIFHLARLYGQPLSGQRFLELASTLGMGVLMRQAVREVVKFIPFAGSVASGALAGASTFALGKAFCYYYRNVHLGHVPRAEDLKRYYQEQLTLAERTWRKGAKGQGSGARENGAEPRG
jgi:uncharacterized protein (DUF697 family)